jgi:hypothetical protein
MDNTTDVLDLFIGSKESYETFKKRNNIVEEEDEVPDEETSDGEPSSSKHNVAVLSKETLKQVDEETMTILKRTRTLHDYNTVYMQSSLEFYDEYYNDESASEELKAAKQIRRIYKIYPDYINAINVRNRYIDMLVDKYGGEEEFNKKLSLGLVRDWIPKMPILSKSCPEYELYLSGIVPLGESETLPEGTVEDVMKSFSNDLENIPLEESYDIETSLGNIEDYNEMLEEAYGSYGIKRNKSSSVTVSDLDNLNKIFKSWYNSDDDKSDKPNRAYFKNAPENIRERFLNYRPFDEPDLMVRIADGEDISSEPEEDLNRMVHDDKTGKNMTRKELQQREHIRAVANAMGFSESRLLNYYNVGSRLDRKTKRPKVSKKRKPVNNSDFCSYLNEEYGLDPVYSDNEYLSSVFTNLMYGDDDE